MPVADPTTVRHEVVVEVPAERAFVVFTEQFDAIKPREHNLLDSPIVETVFEPRVGGAVYDRAEDGSQCRWARVLVFEPPHRVVISWDITPAWTVETDPGRSSEVEVQFIPDGPERTLVALEHRHLDRHGDGWERERDSVDGPGGWPVYLERFAGLADT
ncbi:SRPBCC family protein [Georgenia deserti]|uniref:SRPBCC family protein n=1 Tax=Georgenia deserti TaxID=2093781 RepID=A0ABW4L1B5_9MICO